MCYPFSYCALCNSYIVPLKGVCLQEKSKWLYFCDDNCRSEYILRGNKTLVVKQNERSPRPPWMATGRYSQEEYHAF